MTDQEIVAAAVAEAKAVLLEFLEHGEKDPKDTRKRLMTVMSEHRVVDAFLRLHGEQIWDKQQLVA